MRDDVLVANVLTRKESSVKEGTGTEGEGKSGDGDKRVGHSLNEGSGGGPPHDDLIRTRRVKAR